MLKTDLRHFRINYMQTIKIVKEGKEKNKRQSMKREQQFIGKTRLK